MGKYLTITQLRNYKSGLSLSGMTDLQLELFIDEAESDVDGYMGFDAKVGGFEPGVKSAQSPWDGSRRTDFPNPFVPVRKVVQYRVQISNLTTSGSGFYASITASDVVINNFQSYLEVVPLQAVTYSAFPGIIDYGLNPAIVQCDCEQGYYLNSFNEKLLSNDQQTYYAKRGYWATTYDQAFATQTTVAPVIPFVIFVNGVAPLQTPVVNTDDGSVYFSTALQPTDKVTASYCYQIPDQVRNATRIQAIFIIQHALKLQQGLIEGIQRLRNGDQEIDAPTRQMKTTEGSLCDDAAAILEKSFNTIPIGG